MAHIHAARAHSQDHRPRFTSLRVKGRGVVKSGELRAARAMLGLTRSRLAQLFYADVTPRKIRAWEEGTSAAPATFCNALANLVRFTEARDNHRIDALARMFKTTGIDAVLLRYDNESDLLDPETRGFGIGYHQASIDRLKSALAELKIPTRTITFNRAAYEEWLGTQADSADARAAWAEACCGNPVGRA